MRANSLGVFAKTGPSHHCKKQISPTSKIDSFLIHVYNSGTKATNSFTYKMKSTLAKIRFNNLIYSGLNLKHLPATNKTSPISALYLSYKVACQEIIRSRTGCSQMHKGGFHIHMMKQYLKIISKRLYAKMNIL